MSKLLGYVSGLLMACIFTANLIYINPYLNNIYEVSVILSFIMNGLVAPFIVLSSVVALFWMLEVKIPYDVNLKNELYKQTKESMTKLVRNHVTHGIIYWAQVVGLTLNGNTRSL